MTENHAAIEARDVSVRVGSATLLDSVSWTARRGELSAVAEG